jgi:hypothetical protein
MEASTGYLCIVRIKRNKDKVIKSGVLLEFHLVGIHSPGDY